MFALFCTILTATAYIWDLGLITLRITMVLRTIRILGKGDYSNPLVCTKTDFQTAIQIAFTLKKHVIAVFQNLPNNDLKSIKRKHSANPVLFFNQISMQL